MVSGRRPFAGATGFEVSAGILHQQPEALPSSVPVPMRAIIQRCLEKDPSKRYQHASDVHLALEEMKGLADFPRIRIPNTPKRLTANLWLFLVGLAVVAVVVYGIRSRPVSNVIGYSMLQDHEFENAIAQFQAVANRSPRQANSWDSLGEGYLANGMADKALEAYSRALAIDSTFEPSILGRGLALAALGRYDDALEKKLPDFNAQAFLLSRVGRYREAAEVLDAGRRESLEDAEISANALLTSAWLLVEQKQYVRALEQVRTAETVLGPLSAGRKEAFAVLADLIGGIAEIRSGNMANASARLASQKSRYDSGDRVESNWVAALEGEIALAEGQYDRAVSSFKAAQAKAWLTLGRDSATVFAINLPSRDGLARVEMARHNQAAAIEEYRRLTVVGSANPTSAVLEPRYILELARLLDEEGDESAARVEYGRFLRLWAKADADLPELSEAKKSLP
jgi:tetratricopeptide (TPR) repeat protein